MGRVIMKKRNIPELNNSKYILEQIKACIEENLDSFDKTTSTTKGGKPGTHLQNFLRGTILLSCAGLDAFLKQLIKDSLVRVKENNEDSKKYFQKIVKRQILNQEEKNTDLKKKRNQPIIDGATFIAESLLSDDPRQFVEKYVVGKLLEDSKQSFGALKEIADAFGVKVTVLTTKEKEIRDLFEMRNEISHQFDVVFHNTQGKRNRIERSRTVINEKANLVYEIADGFFVAIKSELEKYP